MSQVPNWKLGKKDFLKVLIATKATWTSRAKITEEGETHWDELTFTDAFFPQNICWLARWGLKLNKKGWLLCVCQFPQYMET